MVILREKLVQTLIKINYFNLARIMLLLALALIAIYVIGLSQQPAVHEAFHDLRHAAGFPCH